MALTIIDGASLKDGKIIKVERAKFELKGEYNAKLKPKKLTKKELERSKKKHEKMLAWEPDKLRGERSKRDKVLVIGKPIFLVKELGNDLQIWVFLGKS